MAHEIYGYECDLSLHARIQTYSHDVDIRLDGKTIIVTGASRGIGLACAQEALSSGANVVLTSRKIENLENAAASLQGPSDKVHIVAAHAGRSDEAEKLVTESVRHFGSVDGIVNNAATNPYFGPTIDIDDARMEKTYQANLAGPLYLARAAWHGAMKESGGTIVNMASIGGIVPGLNIGWYNTLKAGLIHLTKQLATELAPHVRVNAVAPGVVRTDMARALWEEHEERLNRAIPLHRIGEPEDIARTVTFLLSDASSWMTGQTLVVDGGTTITPSRGL
jgi:NAD(P)-dependent dehydrogenase (short-subunit alcohol dehydrogenase family)